jgi:Holliday junction resolvase RusA-like endonuclease
MTRSIYPEPERIVSFTVPGLTPPSTNHYTKPCMYTGKDGFSHHGKKLTKEAKAYKDAVAIFARGCTVAPVTDAERRRVKYRVEVQVYLGKGQRLDSDNSLKVAIDALAYAGVLHSDAFVLESKAIIVKDQRHDPRTHFIVERMEN